MALADYDLLLADLAVNLEGKVVATGRPILSLVLTQVLATAGRPTDSPAVSGSLVGVREVGVKFELQVEVVRHVLNDAIFIEHLPSLRAQQVLETHRGQLLDRVLGTIGELQRALAFLVAGQTRRAVKLGLEAVVTGILEFAVGAFYGVVGYGRVVRDLFSVELLSGLELALHGLSEDRIERHFALD